MCVSLLGDLRCACLSCGRRVPHELRDENRSEPGRVKPSGTGVAALMRCDPFASLLASRLAVLVLRFPRVIDALLEALERQHAAVPASGLSAGAEQCRRAGSTTTHQLAAPPYR